ncbi:MAG: transcriptional regulator [Acidobacteria bacterium]|nr:transcriptional regulator [Acidobacteriota bacterium]
MTSGGRVRYRFDRFAVSPTRRALTCDGREIPLISRYFDLLTLLIARRGEAISRNELLDAVWQDVVVSDGALSQAIRTLRRVLGDDPRDPAFILTVQRHGYRFIFSEVVEERDESPLGDEVRLTATLRVDAENQVRELTSSEAMDDALTRLLQPISSPSDEEDRRDAAELLHMLGTREALHRLDRQTGHADARAVLRDARWDVATAGPVPIFGQPGALRSARVLIGLRLRRLWRLAGSRWSSGVAGGAVAGIIAALVGALALRAGPDSTATNAIFVALPLVGLGVGATGAVGVAGGLVIAEVLFRSRRTLALVVCGAAGGGIVGSTAHLLGLWVLEGLFGGNFAPVTGGVEGLAIGAAVGLGYAAATRTADGGMATPHGRNRLASSLLAGTVCAIAMALLAWSGRYLGAMSLDLVARTFPQSQVGLEPIARLLGETHVGPVTRVVVSAWEGLMFGSGLVLGLTRRPRGHAATNASEPDGLIS